MYQKTVIRQKAKTATSPETETRKGYGGRTLPAVAPAQLAPEEELQMKMDPVQKAGPEEELQMKADPVQKAGPEEELQMKAEPVQKAGPEEELQMKADPVQKAGPEEELQMKAAPFQGKFIPIQRAGEEEMLQGKFDSVAQKKKPFQLAAEQGNAGRSGLPGGLKSGIESLSGFSMDDVHVHYNSNKPKQLKALAYAQGTDIHIAPGQEQHLPHEAWHVAQQKQGRVQPTVQMKEGVPVNDDAGLEKEADVMGAKAVAQGKEMEAMHTAVS